MNKINLENRVAIVTGGAQGFGLAITKRFIESGARVLIWDNDKCKNLATLCETLQQSSFLSNLCSNSSSCGTDVILTILRLRPGTSILPHCGMYVCMCMYVYVCVCMCV